MDKKSTGTKRDINKTGFSVVQQAIGETEKDKPALTGMKADSRKGGLRGGKTRMASLTTAERDELARKTVLARWGETAPADEAGAVDATRSTKQR
jgi:hypothetical protein